MVKMLPKYADFFCRNLKKKKKKMDITEEKDESNA